MAKKEKQQDDVRSISLEVDIEKILEETSLRTKRVNENTFDEDIFDNFRQILMEAIEK